MSIFSNLRLYAGKWSEKSRRAFTQEEINGRRFNADLWKKIIPSWSDGYKNLMEVIAIKEKK